MCQRAGLLIGWDDTSARALVARADCDSWNCEECAARMASRWRLRAEMGARALLGDGYRVDFVTITSHEKLKDFAATETVWRDAWSKLYAALKRKQPNLEYMIVPEKHKDGRMHVHAVWNAGVSSKMAEGQCAQAWARLSSKSHTHRRSSASRPVYHEVHRQGFGRKRSRPFSPRAGFARLG